MSTSEPSRRRVACSLLSRSKITRCPCRSMRKIEPTSASGARSYSDRSVSRTTTPSFEPVSYDLITPCIDSSYAQHVDVTGRGEFAAITRLAQHLRPAPPGEIWIGDVAAVLGRPTGRLLVAT